jgi:hypothetical protein
LDDALRESGLHAGSKFPRDLIADVVMGMSVTVVMLSGLTTDGVRAWLGTRGIHHGVARYDRALHGCLIARAAQGIIFLDASDDEDERRFTFAHEIAHFIIDHLLPRLKAVKFFGDRILPVLNGERPPTTEEMLSAMLRRVPIGLQIHLMSRGASGSVYRWDIVKSEQRADRLALELLAPLQVVSAELRHILSSAKQDSDQRQRLLNCLAEKYGLPLDAAVSYVELFLSTRRKKRRLSEDIFGSK